MRAFSSKITFFGILSIFEILDVFLFFELDIFKSVLFLVPRNNYEKYQMIMLPY